MRSEDHVDPEHQRAGEGDGDAHLAEQADALGASLVGGAHAEVRLGRHGARLPARRRGAPSPPSVVASADAPARSNSAPSRRAARSLGGVDVPLYQVDAFARRPFAGNPAAVCLLDDWLPDDLLQSIATENALSETAFLVRRGEHWGLRWFTPLSEVPLCGHATLAAAHVLFTHLERDRDSLRFRTVSGDLTVTRVGDRLAMDFPATPADPALVSDALVAALGVTPQAVLANERTWMAVLPTAKEVAKLAPDTRLVLALDRPYLLATAPGEDCDFVSRFFAPSLGVPEDPVTGSAHCTLIPYWAARLRKEQLFARQISARGGELWCEARGDRVRIAGHAVLVIEGVLHVPTD